MIDEDPVRRKVGVPGVTPLQLRIPVPSARPGHHSTFAEQRIGPAGALRKPPIDVPARDILPLGNSMIRVLDDEGDAVGDWAGTLDVGQLQQGLRDMLTTRSFDARMLRAHRQGKTSFYMQSLGEEAIACGQRVAAVGRRHVLPHVPPAGAADRRAAIRSSR